VVKQPERNRVRGAPRFGDQPRFESRAGRRNARGLARGRRGVRGEDDVGFYLFEPLLGGAEVFGAVTEDDFIAADGGSELASSLLSPLITKSIRAAI